LGLAQNALGQADAAIALLVQAELPAPTDGRIPFVRAAILARLGRDSEAIGAAKRSFEMAASSVAARPMPQIFLKN
jgi:Flp pilus assembly protein TadD